MQHDTENGPDRETEVQAVPGVDRGMTDVVLIVDDVPDNLAVLHESLDRAGYTVLVATGGETALRRARQARPDVILLDAVMPGMDGFETARRLKADPVTAPIPVIFMTGLTETEHVVAGFAAGGVDYVTKPIQPQEVLARIAAHVRGARQTREARNALDAFGHATLVLRVPDGRILWQTSLARDLLSRYFPHVEDSGGGATSIAPAALVHWAVTQARGLAPNAQPARGTEFSVRQTAGRLIVALHERMDADEWLLVLREQSEAAATGALVQAYGLTAREAEVLFWVSRGKTNKDIGEILGMSAATVKKHLEHIYVKLGVETRTAAAGMALTLMGQGSTGN